MHQSIIVDELLSQWEQVKHASAPRNNTMDESLLHSRIKDAVDNYVSHLRQSRFENNAVDEEYYTGKFIETHQQFIKEFVFQTLKNG